MASLDTISAELRLKIFEYYMEDVTCKAVTYIKASCSEHGGVGSTTTIQKDIRFSITFNPPQHGYWPIKTHLPLSRSPEAFYDALPSTNQKLRKEFIDYLSKDLMLDVVGGRAPCDNCKTIDKISDLVHEEWRTAVKKVNLVVPGFDGLAKLDKSLSDGFPNLQKVLVGESYLGSTHFGVDIHRKWLSATKIRQRDLTEMYEDLSSWELLRWLHRYDPEPERPDGPEWEMLAKFGSIKGHWVVSNAGHKPTWTMSLGSVAVSF